jgi:hypothetical protein
VFDPLRYPIDIVLDRLDQSDQIKEKIKEEFDIIMKKLDFNNEGADIFKKWYIDGTINFHIIFDNDMVKKGIKELRYIDSRKIKKVREVAKEKDNTTGIEIIKEVREYWVFKDDSAGYQQTLQIANEAIASCNSGIIDDDREITMSYLHKAMKPINQLRMLEDAMVIYRLSRAPERRVFYIDVGNLPKVKAEQYISGIMNKFKNKMVYDAQTGMVKDQKDTMTMMEDFWLPRRDGGKGTEITTLPGGQNLGDMEDVLYFQKKMYKALHVPTSRLDSDSAFGFAKSSEISRDEIKFSKFVEKLRKRFTKLFLKLLKTQLIAKGIITKPDWNIFVQYLDFDFNQDSYFSEMKEAELNQQRVELMQSMADSGAVGKYVSNAWVRRHILMQSMDEQDAMDKDIQKEKSNPQYKVEEDDI